MTHFKEYQEYATLTLSQCTCRQYFKGILRFAKYEEKNRGPLDKPYFHRYFTHLLASGTAPNAVRIRHRKPLVNYFNWMVSAGHLDVSPVCEWKTVRLKPKHHEPVLPEEFVKIMESAYETAKNPRRWYWPAAIMVAWHTGLRNGDVSQLKWQSVDFESRTLSITPQKTKRFGSVVNIPIVPELYEMLVKVKAGPQTDKTFLFLEMCSNYRANNFFAEKLYFRVIAERAGFYHLTFHSLRHGFVDRALRAGMPAHVLCSITGHSLAQLETYSHVTIHDKREALEKLAAT